MFRTPRPAARLACASALLLGVAARAQVTITADPDPAISRTPCTLTVSHSDGGSRDWRWYLAGREDSGLLVSVAPNRAQFRTPVTLAEQSFTVVAEDKGDPSVKGTFVLRAAPNRVPGAGERALVDQLFPGSFTPSLRPFLGNPGETGADWKPRSSGNPIRCVAFCDDPAMDSQGNVLVLDNEAIRKIDPARKVTTPCGMPGQVVIDRTVDGTGRDAKLAWPKAMVRDPRTGDLYVGERECIRRITPDWVVTTVLGGAEGCARALTAEGGLAPLRPGKVPPDTRFQVFNGHLDLAILGRELLITNADGVFAYHLDTRQMALVLPVPGGGVDRLGPIHQLNPTLSPDQCAAATVRMPLAVNQEAMAILGIASGFAELELPDGAPLTQVQGALPPDSGSGEAREERKEKPAAG